MGGSTALGGGRTALALAEAGSAARVGTTGETDDSERFDLSKEEPATKAEERAVEVASGLAGTERDNA